MSAGVINPTILNEFTKLRSPASLRQPLVSAGAARVKRDLFGPVDKEDSKKWVLKNIWILVEFLLFLIFFKKVPRTWIGHPEWYRQQEMGLWLYDGRTTKITREICLGTSAAHKCPTIALHWHVDSLGSHRRTTTTLRHRQTSRHTRRTCQQSHPIPRRWQWITGQFFQLGNRNEPHTDIPNAVGQTYYVGVPQHGFQSKKTAKNHRWENNQKYSHLFIYSL